MTELRKWGKAAASGSSNCPAFYEIVNGLGLLIIQGKDCDQTTRARLRLSDDESVVTIPAETVVRAMTRYLAATSAPAGRPALGEVRLLAADSAAGYGEGAQLRVRGKTVSNSLRTLLDDVAADESAVLVTVEAMRTVLRAYLRTDRARVGSWIAGGPELDLLDDMLADRS